MTIMKNVITMIMIMFLELSKIIARSERVRLNEMSMN